MIFNVLVVVLYVVHNIGGKITSDIVGILHDKCVHCKNYIFYMISLPSVYMITYTDKRGVSWNADRQQLCTKANTSY